MSIEENKAIARRLVEEVQNQQHISAMDELYAPNYVYHAAHGVPPTLEGNKRSICGPGNGEAHDPGST